MHVLGIGPLGILTVLFAFVFVADVAWPGYACFVDGDLCAVKVFHFESIVEECFGCIRGELPIAPHGLA
jgi:hypothetical protein